MSFGMMEAMLSFLRRQVGLRTDSADPAGSLHAKVSNVWSNISPGVYIKEVVPSNNVKLASDIEEYNDTTNYIKLKSIIVNVTGIIRVTFDLRSDYAGGTVYARIYRNGSPYGTERSTTSTTFSTYTEDLAFASGDIVELWARIQTTVNKAVVRNFRVAFDLKASATGGSVIS